MEMSYRCVRRIIRNYLGVVLILVIFTSCKISKNESNGVISRPAVPDRVYEPEYYIYKNGRYKFVKGHYRKVWMKRNYWKRSLNGFG
jgi:hypothetical protein